MPHCAFRFHRLPALLLAVCLLAACAIGRPPATRYYLLTPLQPGLAADPLPAPATVAVTGLRLPRYLERPQIVTRSSDNRLELADAHQWGGNLRKNMTRVLARNLSLLLGTPDIAIAPHLPPAANGFRVHLEVMQFERVADGRVRLSVQWRLAARGGDAQRVTRLSDLAHPAVPTGEGFEPTVAAMSTLLGELSREIAAEIRRIDRQGPPS